MGIEWVIQVKEFEMKSIGKIRILVLLVCLGLSGGMVRAQTAAEFLRQKKTQEKYLLKQLAYLELYGSEVRKGYELAKAGLETISGFTNGEFKLHEAFFNALARASSVVKEDFRVGEIASMQLSIRSRFRALVGSSAFPQAIKSYIEEVRKTVINECDQDLTELLNVVLSGEVEMNDKARLDRLKVVYASMSSKAEFTAYFCAQLQGTLTNRNGYQLDLEMLRRLYEKY